MDGSESDQGLTQGFSILIAQRFGANDTQGLWKAVTMSVWLCGSFTVILSIASQTALLPALRLIDTPDDIIDGAAIYLRICYGGIAAIIAYNMLAAILRALGDGRTPLFAMIVASAVNIRLDFLFVGGFHWGIAGAAIATVIAQIASALFCLHAVRRIIVYRCPPHTGGPTFHALPTCSASALRSACKTL